MLALALALRVLDTLTNGILQVGERVTANNWRRDALIKYTYVSKHLEKSSTRTFFAQGPGDGHLRHADAPFLGNFLHSASKKELADTGLLELSPE
jgi:hypothetical protein